MNRILSLTVSALLTLGLLTGCGGDPTPTPTAASGDKDSVVIAMGTTSEPEAGFDPA